MQVVVCNCVGDPFKAWVAGSSPAALTRLFKQLQCLEFLLGRTLRHPRKHYLLHSISQLKCLKRFKLVANGMMGQRDEEAHQQP